MSMTDELDKANIAVQNHRTGKSMRGKVKHQPNSTHWCTAGTGSHMSI